MEFDRYRIRETTIDGPPWVPGTMVKVTVYACVLPMGDGSPAQPRQLQILDWGGPEAAGEVVG